MWQEIKNVYHLLVAILSNIIFFFPARLLIVIGVTGTDGKTTTVSLIYHILKESGEKVSMLSSIAAYIDGKKFDTGFHVTTPSSFSLQRLLKKAVTSGSKYFVLEVTSHAIDQKRIWGIPFKIGVLTNISNEHLDYHKSFDNYVKTKEKLLKMAEIAIVNRDDLSYKLLSEAKSSKSKEKWIDYSLSDNFDFSSDVLIGNFNKQNGLAAVSVCKALGVLDNDIRAAIKTFKMPAGRLDFVYEEDFSVVIDFAHTPNAFGQLLTSLKPIVKGRLIHVFGSAGERDREKRPVMGEVSSKYSDIIILTAEDPRSEDENDIISEIAKGIKRKDATLIRTPNRKDAIVSAIQMAEKGDLVLITGKSHEKSMTFDGQEIPWDEYKEVNAAIAKRN